MSPEELEAFALPVGVRSETTSQILAALLSCTEPGLMHRHALPCVSADLGSGFDVEAFRFAIAVCHDLIKRGVPCQVDGKPFAGCVLIGWQWPSEVEADLAELLRAYVRNYYIPLTAEDSQWPSNYSSMFDNGQTLLEVSIRRKHMPAAVVLLEEGLT